MTLFERCSEFGLSVREAQKFRSGPISGDSRRSRSILAYPSDSWPGSSFRRMTSRSIGSAGRGKRSQVAQSTAWGRLDQAAVRKTLKDRRRGRIPGKPERFVNVARLRSPTLCGQSTASTAAPPTAFARLPTSARASPTGIFVVLRRRRDRTPAQSTTNARTRWNNEPAAPQSKLFRSKRNRLSLTVV